MPFSKIFALKNLHFHFFFLLVCNFYVLVWILFSSHFNTWIWESKKSLENGSEERKQSVGRISLMKKPKLVLVCSSWQKKCHLHVFEISYYKKIDQG